MGTKQQNVVAIRIEGTPMVKIILRRDDGLVEIGEAVPFDLRLVARVVGNWRTFHNVHTILGRQGLKMFRGDWWQIEDDEVIRNVLSQASLGKDPAVVEGVAAPEVGNRGKASAARVDMEFEGEMQLVRNAVQQGRFDTMVEKWGWFGERHRTAAVEEGLEI